jgi:sulfhydrogenase subunit beta (sulfur reductase)
MRISFLEELREFRVADPATFEAFTRHLAGTGKLYGPVRKRNRFSFEKVVNPADLRLDYDMTYLPPRKFFMPPKEALVRFQLAPQVSARPVVDTTGVILMGVHPYDIAGLNVLDRMFSERNPDPNYVLKRRNSVLIGMTPEKVGEHNFAYQMGAHEVEHGYDLFFTRMPGGHVIFEIATRKGKELFAGFGAMREATKAEVDACLAFRDKQADLMCCGESQFTYRELPALLERHFNHAVWAEKAAKCFSCGTCNLVCPTCYCFDVHDEVKLDATGGERVREWDGCLLESFAAVGHGENFRGKPESRYRHRFLRKGRYVFENSGVLGCIGCGRCAAQCLPGIADPVNVFNTLKKGA